MCGISGLISLNPITPDDTATVGAMSRTLRHRGPDGAGEYCAQNVVLAARRLAIIDIQGGSQPLYNEDRSLALVANGEIYNHVELRQHLESRGHRFMTGSDCETIVHAYEEYGTECVTHLRGMFAFALWDGVRRRLVLARDPMGEKPLYLWERNGRILFASEMKALLSSGEVPFELDAGAVDLFFHYQYVPEPQTAIKGVRKLDAATLLIVDVDSWRVHERRYWSMVDAPPLSGNPIRLIREQLEQVAEIIVRADVPVGVALSGGLDSSVVAALVANKKAETLQAFTVGYSGLPPSDERAQARELAQHLDLAFHEVEVQIGDVVDFFPELNYLRDDPIADISGHCYYAVMKLAREHGVPVMLQGQGGDELFWGYDLLRDAAQQSLQKESRNHAGMSAPFGQLSFAAPPGWSLSQLSSWARDAGGLRTSWRRLQSDRSIPANRMVFYDLSPDFRTADNETPWLYAEQFAEQLTEGSATSLFTFAQPWPRVDLTLTNLICDTYLRENGIAQGDRLSMAASVEMRLPLVDFKLVETVVGLRKAQTDVNLPAKSWFKAAVKDLLPTAVLDRPKRGFEPPVRDWQKALFSAYGDSVRDGYLVGSNVLSAAGVDRLASEAIPAAESGMLYFKALVLEQWSRQMLNASVQD